MFDVGAAEADVGPEEAISVFSGTGVRSCLFMERRTTMMTPPRMAMTAMIAPTMMPIMAVCDKWLPWQSVLLMRPVVVGEVHDDGVTVEKDVVDIEMVERGVG